MLAAQVGGLGVYRRRPRGGAVDRDGVAAALRIARAEGAAAAVQLWLGLQLPQLDAWRRRRRKRAEVGVGQSERELMLIDDPFELHHRERRLARRAEQRRPVVIRRRPLRPYLAHLLPRAHGVGQQAGECEDGVGLLRGDGVDICHICRMLCLGGRFVVVRGRFVVGCLDGECLEAHRARRRRGCRGRFGRWLCRCARREQAAELAQEAANVPVSLLLLLGRLNCAVEGVGLIPKRNGRVQ